MPEACDTYYPPPPKGLPFALAPALSSLLGLSHLCPFIQWTTTLTRSVTHSFVHPPEDLVGRAYSTTPSTTPLCSILPGPHCMPGSLVSLGWLSSEFQGPTCFFLLNAEFTSTCHYSIFSQQLLRTELRSACLWDKHFID